MKREDVIKILYGDDAELTADQKAVVEQLVNLHGAGVEKTKNDLTAAQASVKTLTDQLKEANTAIEGFKQLDVEGVKKAADEWKAKAEQAEADGKAQVEKLKFEHALTTALAEAKAKNPATVQALLKTDDLKLSEGGAIIGLEDQLKAIRESNDFLFEAEGDPPPKIVAGAAASNVNIDAVVAAARAGAGLPDTK